ncbi:2'-5' RNA ligase family protein [Nonomuraea sp. NPDC050022]|uniref:2'-5' RNA ligase family protein n=1 Tax=Nonomuraea sp. NPDC050022 TaxID=3364358 RepID=UPI00378DBD71
MSDFAAFFAAGRDALLSGRAVHDRPMVEGGARWGAAAVLRPAGTVLDRLVELAREASTVAGPGHWAHGADCLHVTLRSLEHYRSVIRMDDPLRRAWADALREAVAGLPPVRVVLRGVSPHAGGVLACGYPVDDALVTLQKRFAHGLAARGVRDFERGRVRDRWYVSLVHFAEPVSVTTAEEIVGWCDERADLPIGLAELTAAEIVQAVFTGTGVRLDTLESAEL